MMSVACDEPATATAEEPVLAASPMRRPAITPVLDTRGTRETRRRRITQSINVPVYSRIVYRAGTISVR
jgi:hypothetical protein